MFSSRTIPPPNNFKERSYWGIKTWTNMLLYFRKVSCLRVYPCCPFCQILTHQRTHKCTQSLIHMHPYNSASFAQRQRKQLTVNQRGSACLCSQWSETANPTQTPPPLPFWLIYTDTSENYSVGQKGLRAEADIHCQLSWTQLSKFYWASNSGSSLPLSSECFHHVSSLPL